MCYLAETVSGLVVKLPSRRLCFETNTAKPAGRMPKSSGLASRILRSVLTRAAHQPQGLAVSGDDYDPL